MNITDFDKNTICDNTQLLKALITHLDFETQRLLATFVRLTELKLTMEYYSKNKFSCQGTSKEIDFKCILDEAKVVDIRNLDHFYSESLPPISHVLMS